MEWIGWILVMLLFLVGMAGAVYPVLPGVLAIYGGFLVYGWLISFEPLTTLFWVIQTFILVIIFLADYLVSALGIQKFGGSKAAMWGSTIGLILGPFVIPVVGLLVGPFIGAVIGELTVKSPLLQAFRIGGISLLSLLSSIAVKIVLQLAMIIYFLWVVLL